MSCARSALRGVIDESLSGVTCFLKEHFSSVNVHRSTILNTFPEKKNTNPKSIACPPCQTQDLGKRQLKNGLIVDVCSQCRGTWLDGDEIIRLTKNHEGIRQSLASLRWETKTSGHSCPICVKSMIRGNFLGAKATVDFCQTCQGVWFDSQEITARLQSLPVDNLETPYPIVTEKLAPSEIDDES